MPLHIRKTDKQPLLELLNWLKTSMTKEDLKEIIIQFLKEKKFPYISDWDQVDLNKLDIKNTEFNSPDIKNYIIAKSTRNEEFTRNIPNESDEEFVSFKDNKKFLETINARIQKLSTNISILDKCQHLVNGASYTLKKVDFLKNNVADFLFPTFQFNSMVSAKENMKEELTDSVQENVAAVFKRKGNFNSKQIIPKKPKHLDTTPNISFTTQKNVRPPLDMDKLLSLSREELFAFIKKQDSELREYDRMVMVSPGVDDEAPAADFMQTEESETTQFNNEQLAPLPNKTQFIFEEMIDSGFLFSDMKGVGESPLNSAEHTPLNEEMCVRALIKNSGLTQNEIAKRLEMPNSSFSQRLKRIYNNYSVEFKKQLFNFFDSIRISLNSEALHHLGQLKIWKDINNVAAPVTTFRKPLENDLSPPLHIKISSSLSRCQRCKSMHRFTQSFLATGSRRQIYSS